MLLVMMGGNRFEGLCIIPVVNTILRTPSVELNSMVGGASVASVIHVDAAGVSLNAIGVDVGRNWTTSVDLGHDVFVASDRTILADGNLGVSSHGI